MKLVGRIIFYIFSNAIALIITAELVDGFVFELNASDVFIAAAILTAFNILLRPLLKLVFGPLIILTFGLFIIVINALIIHFLTLDFVMGDKVIIEGLVPLIVATIIFSAINALATFAGRSLKKD